jgi:hypothetical protein
LDFDYGSFMGTERKTKTGATLFFGFSPLTPVMIILLALLDDIPIMTIAYDNTPCYVFPSIGRSRRTYPKVRQDRSRNIPS